MRIAHIYINENKFGGGGAENVLRQLAARQKENGHEVEIWTSDNTWYREFAKQHGITIVDLNKFRKKQAIPAFILFFRYLLHTRKIDIVHSHLFSAILRAGIATFKNFPHVATLHDSANFNANKFHPRILKTLSSGNTMYVAVAADVRNQLLQHVSIPSSNMQVIYNGVDVSYIQSAKTNRNVWLEYGIAPTDVIIITTAVLRKTKRHDILIEAARLMKPQSNFKIAVVGDGPERERVQNLISEYNLHDTVKMVGFKDNIPELLKSSDIFTLTSEAEGLSCSIQEAMAAELPSVVTNVGGNHQLIDQDQTGYLVPLTQPEILAACLTKLVDDPNIRSQFGSAAGKAVAERFSLDTTTNQYEQTYQHIYRRYH